MFGAGDFVTFYDAFKATDNITMVPAVRSPDGTCVDESSCDYERMIACAFDTCADQDCSVDYLVCMDEGKEVHITSLRSLPHHLQ